MLRFAVFDKDGPARSWPIAGAHLVGPGDVAVPGDITFEHGHIVCKARGSGAVGLAIPHEVGRLGRIVLRTCLLPARDRPYTLVVELARHRIKMFIAKSEEWQLFGLGADDPAVRKWEEARALFSRALVITDPLEAVRSARRSLVAGIAATERLVLAHAEILLHWRFGARPASSRTLGVRVRPGRDAQPLRDIVKRDFDLLSIPLRWSELEVEEGRCDWEPIDRWVTWATAQSVPVVMGPLLDFSKRAVPKWLYVWQHDYATCRDLVYEQVEKVVRRYRSAVSTWNIATGLNANDNFQFAPEQMFDLMRMANVIARQARKGARTMVEIAQPFGEHCATNRNSLPPVAFVDRAIQEGIRVDCLGVQLLFGQHDAGRMTRDLMQASDVLDRFAVLDLPLVVSAMGVPDSAVDERGGWWREPWSPKQQSRWAARLFAVAMSKPFVETVMWTDLYDDPAADLPGSGLVSAGGRAKLALPRLVGMRRRLRKPLGPRTGARTATTEPA